MTPERLAEIRPWATQYLRQFPNFHAQQNTGNMMAMEWERIVGQAAEVARLRAQVAAVEALTQDRNRRTIRHREEMGWPRGSAPLIAYIEFKYDDVRAALASGDA